MPATVAPVSAHTDIRASGWIARLPGEWRPYALLARLDRPIGAWLLFLPGLWSILLARAPVRTSLRLIVLFALGSVLMRGAGCVVNDMWDRDLDRRVTRTAGRPLASGALRMRQAAVFLGALLAMSLLILLQLSPLAQVLGVASLALVALYPLAKRVTWWPQAMLGVTFGWGAPMGFAAASGRLDASAGLLYAAAIVWILGYDTVYAHQDREDDALVGMRSTARLFGPRTRPFLVACYALMVVLLGLGRLAGGAGGAVLRGADPAGRPAGVAGDAPRHRRPGLVPAPVQVEPRGRAGRSPGDPARPVAVTDAAAFVRANTIVARPPLVPELALHLATEITPIWQATEAWLRETGTEPPFWAFAWPGSQALARHVLDHPGLVTGRRVLDFAAGCGLAGIACARAGAASVEAAEIDPLAAAAIGLNADLNDVAVAALARDVVGEACRWDVILCGDVCYEAPMTAHILPWLRRMAQAAEVWIADPGRAYVPDDATQAVARYEVPTTIELEDRRERIVSLFRLATRAPAAGR